MARWEWLGERLTATMGERGKGTAARSLNTGFPIRYVLVAWLSVLSAVAYLDRTNISIAGTQIGREFAIDNTHLGWVFSAFLIGYAGFQIPAGLLAKRLGPRRVLALGVIWWSVFTGLTTLIPASMRGAELVLVLVRFALGAGEAVMYPAASQFVERWFPVRERGKANGLVFAGVGIGAGLTPPLVTAIILQYGWRTSFWFSALVGLAAGLIWYVAARDTPAPHPLAGQQEKALIEAGRSVAAGAVNGSDAILNGSNKASLRAVVGRNTTTMVALTVSYFAYGYVAWIFFAWIYIYLAQVRGLNLKTSAVYAMFPFIAMTCGSMLGGVVCDWIVGRIGLRTGRCLLPAISFAVTAVLLVLGSRAQSAQAAGLILAGGAGVLYLAQSSFFAVAADVGRDHVGVVSGVVNMGGQIGGACTATLTPLIAAHLGWEMSFMTAASLAGVGAAAWLIIDPSRTRGAGEDGDQGR
jgi:ACS family glucarate transporter-like MFS transporter